MQGAENAGQIRTSNEEKSRDRRPVILVGSLGPGTAFYVQPGVDGARPTSWA